MIKIDPQQELFIALRQILVDLYGEDYVYDGELPPEGAKYPFYYIAESFQNDKANKSAVFGTVIQTIHVYHNDPSKRGTLSRRLLKIKEKARKLNKTNNYAWNLNTVSQHIMSQNVMSGTTINQSLLHGVLELGFNFSY